MRRLQQEARRLGIATPSASVSVVEASASIAAASARKAAAATLADGDLTEINALLNAKFIEIDERLGALEPPA